MGRRWDGVWEILYVGYGPPETLDTWNQVFENLRSRGLSSVPLIVTDARPGLRTAVRVHYPTSDWQRCIVHFFRNLRGAAEEDSFPPEVLFGRLRKEVLEFPDHETAHAIGMRICEDYKAIAPKTVKILRKGLLEITIHLRHDLTHRKSNRSTNILENLNSNLKRITNKARCYSDDRAAYRISALFCLRYHQKRQERTDQKTA
nr:transposase [Pasteuria penetrans]